MLSLYAEPCAGHLSVHEQRRSPLHRHKWYVGIVWLGRDHGAHIERMHRAVEEDIFTANGPEIQPIVLVGILSLPEHVIHQIPIRKHVLGLDVSYSAHDAEVSDGGRSVLKADTMPWLAFFPRRCVHLAQERHAERRQDGQYVPFS